MQISSSAFSAGGEIPSRYTCVGQDTSPPLAWSGAPAGTRTFALVVDDPDAPDPAAPKRTWVHWVVYDLPATMNALPEGAGAAPPAAPAKAGLNDWQKPTYGGPCPPIGRHRYFFKLYALDTELGLARATKAEIVTAMQGHVLAEAQMIGTFQK